MTNNHKIINIKLQPYVEKKLQNINDGFIYNNWVDLSEHSSTFLWLAYKPFKLTYLTFNWSSVTI